MASVTETALEILSTAGSDGPDYLEIGDFAARVADNRLLAGLPLPSPGALRAALFALGAYAARGVAPLTGFPAYYVSGEPDAFPAGTIRVPVAGLPTLAAPSAFPGAREIAAEIVTEIAHEAAEPYELGARDADSVGDYFRSRFGGEFPGVPNPRAAEILAALRAEGALFVRDIEDGEIYVTTPAGTSPALRAEPVEIYDERAILRALSARSEIYAARARELSGKALRAEAAAEAARAEAAALRVRAREAAEAAAEAEAARD
jgi:hypothetical protein